MSEIADILDKAADLIEPEGAWTQGSYARTAKSYPITPLSDNAVAFCGVGAIKRAAGTTDDSPAQSFVREQWGDDLSRFVAFNDTPGRTQSEVITALREAAAKARVKD